MVKCSAGITALLSLYIKSDLVFHYICHNSHVTQVLSFCICCWNMTVRYVGEFLCQSQVLTGTLTSSMRDIMAWRSLTKEPSLSKYILLFS